MDENVVEESSVEGVLTTVRHLGALVQNHLSYGWKFFVNKDIN